MTVTSVKLKTRGQWKQDEDGSESVVDTYEVVSDTPSETITNVVTAAGIPAKDSSHAEKTTAICVRRSADQSEDVHNVWTVSCEYSTKITTQEDDNPLSQQIKGGMQSSFIERPAYYDARGYPLVNTAGDFYEGIVRKHRSRTFPCTFNFASVPNWLFDLAGTINNAAITIHGRTYPIGTCQLTDVDMPDEPSRGKDGTLYWPISYKIVHDPDGYFVLLPNKGLHELVYQTRTGASAAWTTTTKALYDAKTPTTDRQVIKERIKSGKDEDVGSDIWLDANGQAVRVPTLTTTQLGTGTITAGDATLTLATGAFLTTGAHVGALVRVFGAGAAGRPLDARIESVTSSTIAELSRNALTTVGTAKAVWLSGAIVNFFVLEDLADWSAVPLPNNEP